MSLGCSGGKSSSSRGGLGSAGAPREPPQPFGCPSRVLAGSGISKPSFIPWIYFHTAWWGWFQSWRSELGGSQMMEEGSTTLYKIVSIPVSFMFLAKATAYNNIWPWKLNCFQPRSLWERWWLLSSPVSCVEKPSPKDSQPILSFSFPFNHSHPFLFISKFVFLTWFSLFLLVLYFPKKAWAWASKKTLKN